MSVSCPVPKRLPRKACPRSAATYVGSKSVRYHALPLQEIQRKRQEVDAERKLVQESLDQLQQEITQVGSELNRAETQQQFQRWVKAGGGRDCGAGAWVGRPGLYVQGSRGDVSRVGNDGLGGLGFLALIL